MASLISALSWVKRGAAQQIPGRYVLDENELERVSALARIELEDSRMELERAHEAAKLMGKGAEGDEGDQDDEDEEEDNWVDEEDPNAMEVDEPVKPKEQQDDLSKYNLEDYDKEENADGSGLFSSMKVLTYYKDNADDPYITLNEDEEAEEREELEVLPSDNLLVVAKTEDEISQLEIYVYEESEENLYVHHDLMLPNFPLCLEWLDFPPAASAGTPSNDPTGSGFGNYIAVGTMDPEIEIWSLDVVEAMYPNTVLGRPDRTKAHIPTPLGTGKKKKKKTKHRAAEKGYHVDAVLDLSWNRVQRNLLASASADRTVKLWDLNRDPTMGGDGNEGGAIRSFDIHKDKVQSVQWNLKDPSVLLTGSYDRTVRTFDSRSPESGVGAYVGCDVEALRWDPWENHGFYVSLENGLVLNYDVRKLPSNLETPSPARFTVAAHDGAASAIDINPHIQGCIVTGGADKQLKIWKVDSEGVDPKVTMVTSRDLGLGKVFSAAFSPDDPLIVAAGGSKAKLQIWDVGANFGVRQAFGAKLKAAGRELREKEEGKGVIGLASDDEDSEEEDD